jgi:hypothetical protein
VNVTNFKASLSDELYGPPPRGTDAGVELELFPPGLASAPFKYKDQHTGKTHQMAFYGGVTCLVQHTNGAIEPKVGWAVLDIGGLASSAGRPRSAWTWHVCGCAWPFSWRTGVFK